MGDILDRLSARARGRTPSPIRELIHLMKLPGMISLGGGYPNPDTFVFKRVEVEFKEGSRTVIEGAELVAASQYGPTEGHAGLQAEILRWHAAKDGVKLSDKELVVLNGSQEGLYIMADLFLEEKDSVLVDEPTYPGALAAFSPFCRNFVSVPLDGKGTNTDALAKVLSGLRRRRRRMPKFLYTIPNGHNPGGVALSVERRQAMAALARQYDFFILEDDPYQLVRLEASDPPVTLQKLCPERVVRLDSFSKIFTPGMRIGYASGPAEIMRQFVLFKQASNLHTSSFVQAILARYMKAVGPDGFRSEIRKNCRVYRGNCETMVSAAREHLPAEVKFNVPTEGMFIWFELPEGCDARRMIDEDTKDLGVILVPGTAFSTRGGCRNCMRASYSMVAPEDLREGMKRFARMVEREMKRTRS